MNKDKIRSDYLDAFYSLKEDDLLPATWEEISDRAALLSTDSHRFYRAGQAMTKAVFTFRHRHDDADVPLDLPHQPFPNTWGSEAIRNWFMADNMLATESAGYNAERGYNGPILYTLNAFRHESDEL